MSTREHHFILAAIGHLVLVVLSAARAKQNRLARAVAMLSLDCFGWAFAAYCNRRINIQPWRTIDAFLSALTPVLVLYVVLLFLGQATRRRTILRVAIVYFGALAVSSLPALLGGAGLAWIESPTWAAVFLLGWIPSFVFEVVLLFKHMREQVDAGELRRSKLVVGALLVGGIMTSTDVWRDLGVPLPSLSALGSLLSAAVLAFVAYRHQLFERDYARATVLYVVALAVGLAVLLLGLFTFLRTEGSVLGAGFTLLVVLGFALLLVQEASHLSKRAEQRNTELVHVGRMAAQMAHDLKNPMAALLGATQVLEAMPESGEAAEFRVLIREQAERIKAIMETYDRLGKVEPARTIVDLNVLVPGVIAAQKLGANVSIAFVSGTSGKLECDVDADLLASALENLLSNAIAATRKNGGEVSAHLDVDEAAIVLRVQDTGEGMDPRQAERAFEDFYTTKASGSGLGLAFVRRIAHAHGGTATLESKKGKGTTVTIRLPVLSV
jgi:two-component system, NtrC family, sensor histidine kinase HydH